MQGTSRLIANLERLSTDAPRALIQAVRAVALDVQGRAMMMAPVKEGHLRESASTEINGTVVAVSDEGGVRETGATPPTRPGGVVATVGFNATTKDGKYSYALIQHERTDFHHPLGGEAKYLEKALNEVAGDFEARIGEGVEKFLKERVR